MSDSTSTGVSPVSQEVDSLLDDVLASIASHRRLPESTYRVQFHKGFTFRDAAAIVPYLAALGVTHLYASPYFQAVPGSTHGYDVIDHNKLNPEIGNEQDYQVLIEALRAHGMSHILDIVPNHVGVATNDNAWWNDVLENGRRSRYAEYFDIAWEGSPRPGLHGKVLLPLLGSMYGEALGKGELKLVREDGKVWVRYYQRRFPINPDTLKEVGTDVESLNGTPGDARSFDRLDRLLCRQNYRLAWWRVAPDEINYRRFFDVNDLAAIAMERPEVFEAAHERVLNLLADGAVAGVRIDHPDGLYDPEQYFQRLQRHYVLAAARRLHVERGGSRESWEALRPGLLERIDARLKDHAERPPLYASAEKILAVGEAFPDNWECDGTSGYDFLIMTNGLFVDPAGEQKMTETYHSFTGEQAEFDDLVYDAKRQILRESLASELHMLGHRLHRIGGQDRGWRDFTLTGLIEALREVISCFPVYRTYIASPKVSDTDRRVIETAIDHAISRNPIIDPDVFHFVRDVLLQRAPAVATDDLRREMLHFTGKFQQLTSPTTAKGIEDTAFYRYNRLISLNEVGGEPGRFGISADDLHAYYADRQKRWPYALSALSTHDTKRSEDVRARLNVLSEIPDEWTAQVRRWAEVNRRHVASINDGPAPHPNDEYLLYQTILGAWPLEEMNEASRPTFVARIQAYMQKAMREAKVRTRWTNVNAAYEEAVSGFVAAIVADAAFLEVFLPFQRRIARLGMLNSLSQTLLRLTAPGVPDTYQGCESWDFSLVDPDNRRPVDYDSRRQMLESLNTAFAGIGGDRSRMAAEFVQSLPDGRAKAYLTRQVLHARRNHPGLFTEGVYLPLRPQGPRAGDVFAFERRLGASRAIVVVARCSSRHAGDDWPLVAATWQDTLIHLGESGPLQDAFTGKAFFGDVHVAALMEQFPVALLRQ